MKSHIDELTTTIKNLHGVESTHIQTVHVKESFDGKMVWEGDVEVFELQGHPKAKQAYAWIHGLDDTQAKRHVTVLAVPPITSPETAVKAVIVHDYQQQKK
jgi:hypothetical protein